ncbi:MAG TPA: hypothetical protein H9984_02890 [Candidatus Parabacteroides faecavium]|nr:hypothetical protein [Candidatus Parabacteroides faecavium]
MNKKIFTLFVLLLLLPVTALAVDAPTTLYVGETDITAGGYWKTTADGKLEPGSESDYNVHYDGNGILTLNNATIQGRGNSNNMQPEDYGIYAAPTGNQSVSLTINLIGSNTISGYCGICVGTTTADNASLVIQPAENDPQGSLEASGSGYNGITVSSGSGNASLTINNASVVANTENKYSHGVSIKSKSNAELSLTVNGGSLTAKGTFGIYYSSDYGTNPSTSMTVSDNALIKAIPSIYASVASVPTPKADSESGGIVFDGNSGTVYGDVTLREDLEIGKDETLTIPEDASLTVPDGQTLTNNGTLTSHGTVINQGTLDSSNGMIDCQHHSGGTATCTEKAKCSLCGAEYGELAPHTLTKKEAQAPTCTEPGNIAYWICSVCNKLFRDEAGMHEITEEDTKRPALGHDWGKPVYTWSDDNTACTAKRVCQHDASHTETATATVTSEPTKAPTCTEMGETTYTAKFNEDWAKEQTKTVMDIPATGHHYVNGTCTVCGEKDPDYRPDPISYYNIYVEDVCDWVEVSTSKQVVREGGSITVYVEKDTANYTFDNFKVYYKRSYYGGWDELKEGTQPGEYPIKNIWTHIYIKAEGAEEKEDPTGIESIEGVKVYTKDGSLYVQTPQREQVIIVSMSGAIVKNEEQIGLKQYHGLQPGIYIVRVGDKAYKVRLN